MARAENITLETIKTLEERIDEERADELKTFRCQTCGKVYYSDEVEGGMNITITCEDGTVMTYDKVCVDCMHAITAVVNDSDIIKKTVEHYVEMNDKTQEELDSYRGRIIKFEYGLYRLMSRIMGTNQLYCVKLYDNCDNIKEDFDAALKAYDEIETERDKITTSRNIWRFSAIAFSIFYLLQLIAALIK